MISVIAVFPLKTGNLMFVGFYSQNTSYSFQHYSNGNLGVSGVSLIGFRGWAEENKFSAFYLDDFER